MIQDGGLMLSFLHSSEYDVIIRKVRGTANVKLASYMRECALLLHRQTGNMKWYSIATQEVIEYCHVKW